ncbi:beta-glucan synthesis-associated [Marasmius fiardii PR-910]|nr:beta-glucan synthesis-associated [Marasmius fiardii PR-910]
MVLGGPNYPSTSSSPPFPSNSSSATLLSRTPSKGSMVLYRLASEADSLEPRRAPTSGSSDPRGPSNPEHKSPYAALANRPKSTSSSISTTSFINSTRGFVAYEYDPSADNRGPNDEEDYLHDPRDIEKPGKRGHNGAGSVLSFRGFQNLGVLVLLVLGLLSLFLIYPIIRHFEDAGRNKIVADNINVNASGQVPSFLNFNPLIDLDTPDEAKSRTGFDGQKYQLVFSDEFNQPGRTFFPGEDPYFEAVDMWYGVTGDLEWYDPGQVITRDGALVITMDTVATRRSGLTPGSTAPFTVDENHNLTYRSGMLQSWNKFCFTSGYIEVAVMLPGNAGFDGLWPGAWTMGNLGRPGYRATTDALWPYSYDSCDIGTFPNQTVKGQPATLLPDGAWPEYGSRFSALNGQRLSSCTCPNSDHPGPWGTFDNTGERYRGRGVPEIDILEVQKDSDGPGNVASQSGQYAPFTQGYQYDKSGIIIYDQALTVPNGWPGSPLQQAVSALTKVPLDGHQLSSPRRFVTYGFEYWANPDKRDEGFITWQVDNKPTVKQLPIAMGPDKGPDGMGADQRLIPEEPMSIILNLGISNGWAPPKFETLSFPAEMQFDYIRIYQREGNVNIGCDPKGYPTADYISKHIEQYTNINLTSWQDGTPRNRLVSGPLPSEMGVWFDGLFSQYEGSC